MDDYVPFELSKKLNKKGYSHDYNDFGYRLIYSDECTIKFISNIGAYEQEYYGENIPCPTISEVLKWLRKDKRIDSGAIWDNRDGKWVGYVSEMDIPDLAGQYVLPNTHDTYEQAALAGIEYVLDNLI